MSKLVYVKKVIFQLMCCMLFPVIFYASALMSDISIKPDSFRKWIIPLSVFGFFIMLFLAFVFLKIKTRSVALDRGSNISIDKRDIIFIAILIIVTLSLRIPMYGTFQRWDSGEYFYRTGEACSRFDFSFDSLLNGFKVCAHSNYGFSMLGGTCMFISLYSYRLVNAVQIVLSVLAVLCLYSVLKNMWKLSSGKAFSGALMVSMIPIYLGLSTYFTPDFMMFVYFIFAIYFQSKGYHILEAFMMILMVFCKESATLIVAGYYGFAMLYIFLREKNGFVKKIKAVVKSREFWIAGISCIIFVVSYFTSTAKWNEDSGNADRAFTYSRVYVIIRIKQMFFTHFTSIMTVVTITAICIILFKIFKKLKGKPLFTDTYMKSLIGLIGAMSFICAISVVYHIAVSARYDVYFVGCLAILMVILLNILCMHYGSRKINVFYYVLTGILAFLFMIESYVNIDPLARKWFKQLDLGRGYTIGFESELEDYMGDSLVYNFQYAWLDRAIDQMLRDSDYNGDKGVYVPYSHVGPNQAIQLDGNGRFIRVCWNDEKKERDYYLYGEDFTPVNALYIDDYHDYFPYKDTFYDEYLDKNTLKEEGVYASVPYYADVDDYLPRIDYYFYHGEKKHVDKGTGRLPYYDIYKKDSYMGAPSVNEIIDSSIDPTNVVTEKDISVADSIMNGNYDSFYEEVDVLYNYKIGMNLKMMSHSIHDRVDVRPMDGIMADFVATDENGNEILRKEWMGVTVGGYGLIDEVDEKLQEMNVGDDATVEYIVPDKVLGLEAYTGQKIYINIHVESIACEWSNPLNELQLEEYYRESFDYVWNYYQDILIDNVIKEETENYNNGSTEVVSQESMNRVNEYMDEYMAGHGFDEDTFISDYARISAADYEKAKIILANSTEKLDELKEKLDAAYTAAWGM